jgi:hypothetical protein
MNPRRERRNSDSREPVVRPYALTAGRTRPSGATIDLIALISTIRSAPSAGTAFAPGALLDLEPESDLEPEHLRVLRFCRGPVSLADLAVTLALPLGVVRILIADPRDRGLVRINQPAATGMRDVRVLKEVADALRRI